LTNARGATGGIRDLDISPGCIEATISGDTARGANETFRLQVRLPTLHNGAWRRVLSRLAGKALYAARLLSGEMPRDIERVFAQSRTSLFPRRGREIEYSCSCDQVESPCAHVAAVQFALAEAFDSDPFLLFELRGRSREQMLAELREIRGAGASNDRASADVLGDEDAQPQPRPEDYTVAGEDLAILGFHIAAPDVTVGAIRALGPPRSWPQPLALLQAFVPLYRAASAAALDIAWLGEEKVPASAQLPEPETEAALVAMAESMAVPTRPSEDVKPPSRRRRGRKVSPRRQRGRRGRGRGGQSAQGRGQPRPDQEGGAGDRSHPPAGQTGKKRRRRRRRGGAGGAGSPGSSGGGQTAPEQANRKKRRRRRRGGGGSKA
jgi:uncharacterized Zn finger protein